MEPCHLHFYTQRNGFFQGDSSNPAHLSLLLIIAGDIHQNPGPIHPCSICAKNVTAGFIAPKCSKCQKWVHARCSGLNQTKIRKLPDNHTWECQNCTATTSVLTHPLLTPPTPPQTTTNDTVQNDIPQPRLNTPTTYHSQSVHTNLSAHSAPLLTTLPSKENQSPPPKVTSLRILQWNCQGINTSSTKTELIKFLSVNDIDVAVLQETHLRCDTTFHLPGYAIQRTERVIGRSAEARLQGGGILTAIKSGIQHSKPTTRITSANDLSTDAHVVDIHLKKKTLRISNVYVPPINEGNQDQRNQNFKPEHLPSQKDCLILGDFNAHSDSWDAFQPNNYVGSLLETHVDDNDMVILNDGSATRINPATSGPSAPDVSLCSSNIASNITWTALPDQLGSDHHPIIISIKLAHNKPKPNRRKRMAFKKAKWDLYQLTLTTCLLELDDQIKISKSTDEMNQLLTTAMLEATKHSIPMGSSGNRKPWWSQEIDEAVKERNEKRSKANKSDADRREWLKKSEEVRQLIKEAKRTSWAEYVSKLNAHSDPSKVWGTIKAIDGRAQRSPEGAALEVNGQLVTSSSKKAQKFAQMYRDVAEVRNTKLSRPDAEDMGLPSNRDRNYLRNIRQYTKQKCTCHEGGMCSPLTMAELEAAIKQLKNTSAGDDGVHNQLLQHLPQAGKSTLLHIYNRVWSTGQYPAAWRKGTIIPILKPGKDPSHMSSYRPIQLTSCVGKLFERLVKERTNFWLESSNILNPKQAGFRSLRNTEDQVTRITQHIIDGLNETCGRTKGKRTIMALIDFSRAFDRVWHTGLLWKLMKVEAPACLLRIIKAFLSNRMSRVRFEGSTSRYYKFTGGVPQGGVLSPILFLTFINDITNELPTGIEVSLFADDLALLATHEDLNKAEALLQKGLDCIERWSRQWKMSLNVEKCEVTHFTKNTHEASWRPTVKLQGKNLQYTEAPTFLGVTFDRQMSFKRHVEKLKKKVASRMNTLRCLTGKSWGSHKEDLRLIYITYIKSAIKYGYNAWYPCLSEESRRALEVMNNSAARIITGCTKDTNTVLLLNEAELLPLKIEAQISQTTAYERSLRLPYTNPVRATAENPTRQRLKSLNTWRETGKEISTNCGLGELPREELLPVCELPPWKVPKNFSCNADLITHITKNDPPEIQKKAAEETISSLPEPNIQIFTDGSARNGNQFCGSGVCIKEANGDKTSFCKPSGKYGSSYRSEATALLSALKWITDNHKSGIIQILTDSKALVMRLMSGPFNVKTALENNIWLQIERIATTPETMLHVQWIPGHCGIEGNEEADHFANQGQIEPQSEVEIDLASAKNVLKRYILNFEWGPQNVHGSQPAGIKPPPERDKESSLTRKQRRTLAQLRCNEKSPILQKYMHKIGVAPNDSCLFCGHSPDNLEHVLQSCPKGDKYRGLLPDNKVEALWTHPVEVVEFLQASDRLPIE